MKTRREILDYVQAKIVEQGGRAVEADGCSLETSDGKRCGFSLCLTDSGREFIQMKNKAGYVPLINSDDIERSLMPEFRGHTKAFWRAVQVFHDSPDNWDSRNLLTEKGVDFYNNIDLRVDGYETEVAFAEQKKNNYQA